MTDNYTSSLNEIIDEIAKVMAAQSGNHKANYRSPHYQRKAKAVYETTITAMGDASGRDCPDCGLTMRGGQHVCPSPESKDTLNRITSEELDEYTRLSRTDQWWQELVGSDVRRLIGEVRYWKEQAFRPLGDNHHNAKLCPHCNQGSEIPDTTEIEILEDEVIIAGRSYVPKQEQGEISDANIKAIKYKIAAVIYERIKMKRPNLPPGNGEAMAYANAALDIVKSYLRYPVREIGGWQPMETAPKDGTAILLKFKDDLSSYNRCNDDWHETWQGIAFVGRNRGDEGQWAFAAPVGHGGFTDVWFEGWKPISEIEGGKP